jgi:putative SOS response-associated peptidase YedK
VVNKEEDDAWLNGSSEENSLLMKPLPDGALDYRPCQPIKSNKKLNRSYLGNVEAMQSYLYYPELEESQGSLF